MANISDAFGTCTITVVGTEAQARDILYILNKYQTRFPYETEYQDPIDVYREGEKTVLCTYFDGSGRWTYRINIEILPIDLDYYITEEDRKTLKNLEWTLEYKYKDKECGCGVLYEAHDMIIHGKNKPLEDSLYVPGDKQEYKWSWCNLLSFYYDWDYDLFAEQVYLDEYLPIGNCDPSELEDDINDLIDEMTTYLNPWVHPSLAGPFKEDREKTKAILMENCTLLRGIIQYLDAQKEAADASERKE